MIKKVGLFFYCSAWASLFSMSNDKYISIMLNNKEVVFLIRQDSKVFRVKNTACLAPKKEADSAEQPTFSQKDLKNN